MSLPLKPLPTVERWDCHQCGVCCRGSIVPLSDEDLAKLKAQKWEEHPDLAGTPTTVRDSWLGRDYRLAHKGTVDLIGELATLGGQLMEVADG